MLLTAPAVGLLGIAVDSVAARASELVRSLQAKHTSRRTTVVLVSHGDTLQILQTVFEGVEAKVSPRRIPPSWPPFRIP